MQKIAEPEPVNEDSIMERILCEINGNPTKINKIRNKWVGLNCEKLFAKVFYDMPSVRLSPDDFDVGCGIEIMGTVFDAVERNDFVFSKDNLRGEIIPEGIGEKEKALFIFYAAPFLPRTKSRDVYGGMCKIFASHAEIFDPNHVRSASEEKIAEIVSPVLNKVNRRNEVPRKWKTLAEYLKDYDDNPLEIFSGCDGPESMIVKLDTVPFYGRKTANYLLNTYSKEKMIPVGSAQCNFAVDIHKTKFAVQTGMLKEERREICFRYQNDGNNNVIEKYYGEVCKEGGFDILEADENIWQWSSNGCSKRKCKSCPIDEKCTIGIWSRSMLDYGIVCTGHDYLGRADALKQKKLEYF